MDTPKFKTASFWHGLPEPRIHGWISVSHPCVLDTGIPCQYDDRGYAEVIFGGILTLSGLELEMANMPSFSGDCNKTLGCAD